MFDMFDTIISIIRESLVASLHAAGCLTSGTPQTDLKPSRTFMHRQLYRLPSSVQKVIICAALPSNYSNCSSSLNNLSGGSEEWAMSSWRDAENESHINSFTLLSLNLTDHTPSSLFTVRPLSCIEANPSYGLIDWNVSRPQMNYPSRMHPTLTLVLTIGALPVATR